MIQMFLNRLMNQQIERFLAKTRRLDSGCLEWLGWVAKDGYGHFWLNGKTHMAHRAGYILLVGEIPQGYELDHICRFRWCVEPSHLEPVTRTENEHRKPAWAEKRKREANGNQ